MQAPPDALIECAAGRSWATQRSRATDDQNLHEPRAAKGLSLKLRQDLRGPTGVPAGQSSAT